jgi:ACS family tartrate transporter-like MFS transporter
MTPLYRRIALRLIPLLMLLYFVAYLDRVNISFAALTMNRDIGISASLFGVAAGMFFFGYFLFELPSNLILVRVGARRWIACIMFVWGIVSISTALVHGPVAYVALRFLLGAAEAGFFPGIILYLTFWLPPAVRSSIIAVFVAAIPLSNLIGAPISAHILLMNNQLGIKGWQWLFLLEGAPAVLISLFVPAFLPSRPEEVHWLSAEEKQQIARDLREAEPPHAAASHSVLQIFSTQPAIYAWSFVYFCLTIGIYGLGFWIPTVLASHGMTLRQLSWAAALPYLVAILGALWWNRRSDRRGERRLHLAGAYVAAAAGFLLAAFAPNAAVAITGFSLAAAGVIAAMPVFWSASTLELAGPLLASHIAVINSLGNLGGFVGPALMGWLHQATHTYVIGLASIAAALLLGALTTARLCKAY